MLGSQMNNKSHYILTSVWKAQCLCCLKHILKGDFAKAFIASGVLLSVLAWGIIWEISDFKIKIIFKQISNLCCSSIQMEIVVYMSCTDIKMQGPIYLFNYITSFLLAFPSFYAVFMHLAALEKFWPKFSPVSLQYIHNSVVLTHSWELEIGPGILLHQKGTYMDVFIMEMKFLLIIQEWL